MAKKRSLVDATLTVTAASDVFEQDIDEYSEAELEAIRTEKNAARGKPPTAPPKTKAADKKKADKKAPAKAAQEPPPADQQTAEPAAEPTFSFEEYKNMAKELSDEGGDLGAWWVGICSQAMTDLGVNKYDMLQKYLTGALGMTLDNGGGE